jgi:prefoldin subunit 5
MTVDERIEFLLKAVEATDSNLDKLTADIRQVSEELRTLGSFIRNHEVRIQELEG